MIFPSSAHLYSCFCLRSEGGQGTAFIYRQEGKKFLVTARHVLGGTEKGGFVLLRSRGNWESYEVESVRHDPGGQDLALFTLVEFVEDVDYRFSHHDDPAIFLGQELKFTGFPHGLENTLDGPAGFSTPLVRTAFFSGAINRSGSDQKLLILDGLNNPGYSGSPVWAPGPNSQCPSLIAVISGYRVELKSKSGVYRAAEGNLEERVDGLFVKPNSGMIHAVPYSYLRDLASAA